MIVDDGTLDHCSCCAHRRIAGCGGPDCPCTREQLREQEALTGIYMGVQVTEEDEQRLNRSLEAIRDAERQARRDAINAPSRARCFRSQGDDDMTTHDDPIDWRAITGLLLGVVGLTLTCLEIRDHWLLPKRVAA